MIQFDINAAKNQLEQKGIRPSFQRLKILEFLYQHPDSHPTAEMIYENLCQEIPTLSRATVYNTLHSFSHNGLVNSLSIDGIETHYDVMLEAHGHFKCSQCGRLFNFPVAFNNLHEKGLENYQINHKDVIFTGICPDCIETNQSKKGE